MTTLITVRNKDTGQVGMIREDWYHNPVFNNGILERAEPGAKSAWPGMWKSKLDPVVEIEVPEDEINYDEEDED